MTAAALPVHPVFEYARIIFAKLSDRGWRPFFGWGVGFIILCAYKFALIDAPSQAIALGPDYYTFLNTAAGIFAGIFLTRSVEKVVVARVPVGPGAGVNPHGGAAEVPL